MSIIAGVVVVIIVDGSLYSGSLTSGFLDVEVELFGLSAADEDGGDQDEKDHGHYADDHENTNDSAGIIEEPFLGSGSGYGSAWPDNRCNSNELISTCRHEDCGARGNT